MPGMSGPTGRIDAPRAPRRRPLLAWGIAAALTLGLDQLTKAAALAALGEGHSLPVLGGLLHLTLTHNAGGAFGLLPLGWLLVLVGVLCCLGLPLLLLRWPGVTVGPALLLGLIWGGAAGNLLDRIRTGAVLDFIDLRVWPVFNIADIALTVGFAALAAHLLFHRAPRAS